MNNAQIAEVFEIIADLLVMKGEQAFTVRAYERVARTIDHLSIELEQLIREGKNLRDIEGIGEAISKKITELVQTGKMPFYEDLKAEFPPGIIDIIQLPGVGPKTAQRLWKEGGIETLDALEAAAKDGRVAAMPRMGAKAAEKILRGIQTARTSDARMPIARASRAAERVAAALIDGCLGLRRLTIAGSLRRFEETIGNIDLVAHADAPAEVLDALEKLPNATERLARSDDSASVMLSEGIRADLRVVRREGYGSTLQYYTGSKSHNEALEAWAKAKGAALPAPGADDGYEDEEALYGALGLQFIPPELRVGGHEIEVASKHEIPKLVEVADIRGDLHDHTNWTDGRDAMEDMVAAAKARGLQYIAITDHSVGRGIANGLTIERLAQHGALVAEVEQSIGGIRVLRGTEMDIRADGSLDYDEGVLEKLDWVIGSIHSAMDQDEAKMTDRIIKAMRSPHVDVIGHLTTRLIGERPPIRADFEAIFRAAAETGTAMEVNASPERLDLKDTHVARARELGVPLVISTDSHAAESLDNV
ncbi:MAG: DNA polymerase/3'-5' exonuclease PolX, partial [SAR202 cluster bacterium]|nr:DNA polymerase/3'-5' exonuclease PolX [SAR202 cluster bacterium]